MVIFICLVLLMLAWFIFATSISDCYCFEDFKKLFCKSTVLGKVFLTVIFAPVLPVIIIILLIILIAKASKEAWRCAKIGFGWEEG